MSDAPGEFRPDPNWPVEFSLPAEGASGGVELAEFYGQMEHLAAEFDRPPTLRLRQYDLRRWERAPALAEIERATGNVLDAEAARKLPALGHQAARLAALIGKLDAAATLFRRAVDALAGGPAKVVALQNLLLVLLEAHRHSEALEAIGELTALSPADAPVPVGRFEVVEILGSGTFAVVFRCRDRQTGEPVVVKALAPQPPAQRFPPLFQESAVLLGVDHPSVVRCLVHGYVDVDRQVGPYCVMEFFDGINLHEYIRRYGPLSWQQVRQVLIEALQTLATLHAQGIVHADIKPGNLLVRCDHGGWRIKLIDFGIAVHTSEPAAELRPHERRPATPGFSAPEQIGQIAVERLTPAADIYALARTACYCLFGRMEANLSELDDYPGALVTVIRTSLLIRPEQRPTADDLLAILLKPTSPEGRTGDEHATVGTVMPAEPGPASGIGTHAAGPGTSNKGPLTDVELEPPQPAAKVSAMPPRRVSPPEVPPSYSPSPGTVAGGPMSQGAPGSAAQGPVARGASVVGSAIGAIGRVIGSLFKHNGKMAPNDGNHRPAPDPVDCTVFAPAWVEPGSTALVQVAVHLEGAAGKVALMAKEFDTAAERRGVKRLETEIPRGSRLLFQLCVPGLVVDDAQQSVVWRGESEMLQFGVAAPADANERSVVGALLVSIDGIPCGRVKFTLRVVRSQSGTQPAPKQHRLARYRKVFVSYSSADRSEVLKRVQMLRQIQVEVFQDVLSLEPGQRWQRELYRRIDDSDLFLLFWSSSAKASEWVSKEVQYALNRQRHNGSELPDIIPVILEGPPIPPPPPELAHLHFNDQILNYLQQGAA